MAIPGDAGIDVTQVYLATVTFGQASPEHAAFEDVLFQRVDGLLAPRQPRQQLAA